MYNGIGLQTARGSGTNGYVQRNLSFVKRKTDKVDYTSEEQLKKLDAQQFKQPNAEILLHEKKRKDEVKCLEMKELMEEQGYSEEEINKKLTLFRQLLLAKSLTTEDGIELDESGRPIARASHQLQEASNARNDRLKKAFGISEYFQEGSSLDPQRREKERVAMESAQKKYDLVDQPLSDGDELAEQRKDKKKKKKKERKRKKSSSVEKDSPSEEDEEEEKRKKSKKHKSGNKDHKRRDKS